MNFFRFLFSGAMWGNVAAMILAACITVWGTFMLLESYTHHGESITVPDLNGMTLDQVERHLKSKALRYTILDSAYLKDLKPETVLDQNPRPGSKVKENRRIYLTVNAKKPPLVKLPDLTDFSLRNADVQLESAGLNRAEIVEYVPDPHKVVKVVMINNKVIDPYTEIPKGSIVTLVMGNGLGDTKIEVPQLVGLTFHEAKLALRALSLNVGAVVEEGNIPKLENALVYYQSPEQTDENDRLITIGEPVDLFLKVNDIPQVEQKSADKTEASKEDEKVVIKDLKSLQEGKLPKKEDKPKEEEKKKPLVRIKKTF